MSTAQWIWTAVLLALLGLVAWLIWRRERRILTPWKMYKWALGPLPPLSFSMMQNGLAVERKKEEPIAVVVFVKELQPGDTGWIHIDHIRSFGGHLWLHELAPITSQVRKHNAGFVEIEVDGEGILVNAPERVREMTEEEQSASCWYHAMRLVDEDEEEEKEEDEGPASS